MFATGGVAYTLSRVLTEKLSPVGKYFALSGMGDAAAAGGLGLVANYDYAVPLVHDRQGNTVVPAYVQNAIRAAIPAVAPRTGMAGNRFAGRFGR